MRASRLLLTLAILVSTTALEPAAAEVPEPRNDPFYVAPRGFQRKPVGAILRWREVDVSLSQVPLTAVGFHAYQLLYRTADVASRPIANVTTLIVPDAPPPAGGRTLVSLQNAENSLDPNCAPSYQLQVGQQAPSGALNRNLMVELAELSPELVAGRVLVVPDSLGPKKGYIVRLVNARMVLDSIRAAQRFSRAGLAGTKTPVALFGYSGGGFETAAANELQPTYAPELNVVAAAAGGVPAGTMANIRYIDGTLAAGTLMAVMQAIDRSYPRLGLWPALNDEGRTFAREIQTGCSSAIFARPLAHFDDWTTTPNFLGRRNVRSIVQGNALGKQTPRAPTFFYNALSDEIIWIAPLDALVQDYCASGADLYYVRDPAGLEHIQGTVHFTAMALRYIEARFAGVAIPSTCGLPANALPAF